MHVFNLAVEQMWDPKKHVEKILGREAGGDFTVACWEPGQVSPHHCHPHATEIYFCYEGGGMMRIPGQVVPVTPGSFCVHPPGEVHEYVNGPARSMLFRVRYGADMETRTLEWPTNPAWTVKPEDIAYFREHPVAAARVAG